MRVFITTYTKDYASSHTVSPHRDFATALAAAERHRTRNATLNPWDRAQGTWEQIETGANHPTMIRAWERRIVEGAYTIEEHWLA